MNRIIKARIRYFTGRWVLALVIAGYGMSSCTYYTNDYNPLVVPDNVSFEADIIFVFDVSCSIAGCHDGTISPNLRGDAAYKSLDRGGYIAEPGVAENNVLYQVIDGGTMDAYATDLDRAYIKKWLDEGAQDN